MIPPWSNGIKEILTKLGLKMLVDWFTDFTNADGRPKHLADADAPNDMVYFSTTANKMVYKSSNGTINNLY